jgi:hypothetical protein
MASDATTTIVVAVLSSGAIATVVGAIINGAFTKRKLSAEATEVITNAASSVVTQIEKQRDDLRVEMVALKTEHIAELERCRNESTQQIKKLIGDHLAEVSKLNSAHAQEREDWKHFLQLHVAWDWLAIEKLALADITLPDPPPILPRDAKPDAVG